MFSVKRVALQMRRLISPQREVMNRLARDEYAMIDPKDRVYFRDIYDQFVRLADINESLRDLLSGTLDTYLSVTSNRMNEIMKVLTIFTVVFIPLNFIASIYGMNFNTDKSPWNMPELDWVYGYPVTLGLMAAVALFMLIYFRKKRWIGSMPYNGESRLDHPMRVQLDDRMEHKHHHD